MRSEPRYNRTTSSTSLAPVVPRKNIVCTKKRNCKFVTKGYSYGGGIYCYCYSCSSLLYILATSMCTYEKMASTVRPQLQHQHPPLAYGHFVTPVIYSILLGANGHCNEVHLNYVKCIIVYTHITLEVYRLDQCWLAQYRKYCQRPYRPRLASYGLQLYLFIARRE